MAHSDQTEFCRGIAHGTDINGTPLVVGSATQAVRTRGLVVALTGGGVAAITVTTADGLTTLGTGVVQGNATTEVSIGSYFPTGIRVTSSVPATSATIIYHDD